jgi:hypothetical protein
MTREELKRLANLQIERLDAVPREKETCTTVSVFKDASFFMKVAEEERVDEEK